MWAELALNESKQGIIRNWFTFFLVSSPLEGQQGVIQGVRLEGMEEPSSGVQMGGEEGAAGAASTAGTGAGHTLGTTQRRSGFWRCQPHQEPWHCGSLSPEPHIPAVGTCPALLCTGSSTCKSGKLPLGKDMSFSFTVVPHCILSL